MFLFHISLAAEEHAWLCAFPSVCWCNPSHVFLSLLPPALPSSLQKGLVIFPSPAVSKGARCSADYPTAKTSLLLQSAGLKIDGASAPGIYHVKTFYCYLVTFPCAFMLIYITVVFDLWQIFFKCSSAINCVLSMVLNLRNSVNYGIEGKEQKPFDETFDHNFRQSWSKHQNRLAQPISLIQPVVGYF